MHMEGKSLLQAVKLEISRTFKLTQYERMAFHKILGILRSERGMEVLLNELGKSPDVRASAIGVLTQFIDPRVLESLVGFLPRDIANQEKIDILRLVRKSVAVNHQSVVKELISKELESSSPSHALIAEAFNTLRVIGANDEDSLAFVKLCIEQEELNLTLRCLAIVALSGFRDLGYMERLLELGDQSVNCAVYRSIYDLIQRLTARENRELSADERLYTFSQEKEDEILLNIRVLLGKNVHSFDSYSDETKIYFLSSMLVSNHREMLIYVMKALTSGNEDLIRQTLFAIFKNIRVVREPDKLLRNLLTLTVNDERNNQLIVDIFERYFLQNRDNRQFNILRDKTFSYIVVMIETYFETYRKEFIVADVIEKSFPEEFQEVRKLVLEKCTPELKKQIIQFLVHDDPSAIRDLIKNLSREVHHIDETEIDSLKHLIHLLLDEDAKSRENSSSRIESVNFEKRYLRFRFIRLCQIISRLNIQDAASPLVNVYNFVKKYPDPTIMDITIRTLSTLNYSYMLGEIEIMLQSGIEEDQKTALELMALFNDPGSLNILLEFIAEITSDDSFLLRDSLSILLERDIQGNATVTHLCKKIIEHNNNQEIVKLAVLGVGLSGKENDVEYLNSLFFENEDAAIKECIIRSIEQIFSSGKYENKRQLMKYLQGYLKDAGIRVRLYGCLLLVRLGNENALKLIRDMLVIKNKAIQREILTVLGTLQSIEFSFFLISLLNDEYGISSDIIQVLKKLPEDDLKEIDSFIVNMFRKHEAPESMGKKSGDLDEASETEPLSEKTLLSIKIIDALKIGTHQLIQLQINIADIVETWIKKNNGAIVKSSIEDVRAFFNTPDEAVSAAYAISKSIRDFNKTRRKENRLNCAIQLDTLTLKIICDEIPDLTSRDYLFYHPRPLVNRIIAGKDLVQALQENYFTDVVSDFMLSDLLINNRYLEIVCLSNFSAISSKVVDDYYAERERIEEEKKKVEDELRKIRLQTSSKSSVAIAGELEIIGDRLKKQLDEIEIYVQRRSTDRELLRSVRTMLKNVYDLYKVEISRLVIK